MSVYSDFIQMVLESLLKDMPDGFIVKTVGDKATIGKLTREVADQIDIIDDPSKPSLEVSDKDADELHGSQAGNSTPADGDAPEAKKRTLWDAMKSH
jgi:hypothetical protein